MTTTTLLALQGVLSLLSAHARLHLNEVETDLTQTNLLLKEAIDKLGGSFMALHEAVVIQQQIVERLLAAPADERESAMQALRKNVAAIDSHVNSAVTGLQFQDMTDQLIGRTIQRVVGLREVLEAVGDQEHVTEGENLSLMLARIQMLLETESSVLDQRLRKAVKQTHMESGDIELF